MSPKRGEYRETQLTKSRSFWIQELVGSNTELGDYSLQKSKMNDNNVISDRREDL